MGSIGEGLAGDRGSMKARGGDGERRRGGGIPVGRLKVGLGRELAIAEVSVKGEVRFRRWDGGGSALCARWPPALFFSL